MRPLIHIGYHKTGSTWLQQRYFPNTPGWSYLDRHKFSAWIINVHSLQFEVPAARAKVDEWLSSVMSGSVPVTSHERLSGYPHSGGYDSKEIAARLAAVIPEARILITIREQLSMLFSGYRQYVRDGGHCSVSQYLAPRRTGDSRVPCFRPEHYAYDRLIGVYQDLFGAPNVLVLPFEMFRDTPEHFVRSLETFAEVPPTKSAAAPEEEVNAGLPMAAVRGLRWANRLFHRNDLNPAPIFDWPRVGGFVRQAAIDVGRHLPASLARMGEANYRRTLTEFAGDRYGASNVRTAAITGLPLATWRYQMPSGDASHV